MTVVLMTITIHSQLYEDRSTLERRNVRKNSEKGSKITITPLDYLNLFSLVLYFQTS